MTAYEFRISDWSSDVCSSVLVADRQRVAGADRGFDARDQRGADCQAARRDDVATFAVGVAQQRDVRRTVGVVLNAFYLGRDAVLVATEIDDTVDRKSTRLNSSHQCATSMQPSA